MELQLKGMAVVRLEYAINNNATPKTGPAAMLGKRDLAPECPIHCLRRKRAIVDVVIASDFSAVGTVPRDYFW